MKVPNEFNTKINYLDNAVRLYTLSPNERYFYRHQGAQTLDSNGPPCSPVAFYNIQGNLIYYNRKKTAQFFVTNKTDLHLVCWSSTGDLALILERDLTDLAYFVVIDLQSNTFCSKAIAAFNSSEWLSKWFSYLPEKLRNTFHDEVFYTDFDQRQDLYKWANSLEDNISLRQKAGFLDENGALVSIIPYNASDAKSLIISALDEYYRAPDKVILRMIYNDGFGNLIHLDEFMRNEEIFDDFQKIKSDKPGSNLFTIIDNIKWRP